VAPHRQALMTNTALAAKGDVWRYLDTGVDPGTAWRDLPYDDSAWKSGPSELGYGEGDEATTVGYGPDFKKKYITTYFRHRFGVEDPTRFANLIFRLLADDGAVVYLNGVEVLRENLPAGPVARDT